MGTVTGVIDFCLVSPMKALNIYSVNYPGPGAASCPYIIAHYSAHEAETLLQNMDESDETPHAELIDPEDYASVEMLDENGQLTTLADSLFEDPIDVPCIIAGDPETEIP